MMMRLGITMNVTCNKQEILEKLKTNRDQHSKMVAESRAGYVKAAQAELEKKLGKIREGKIVALSFQLQVPKDYTTAYDTAINMLTAHQGDTITLSASEYRMLVEDEWDWFQDFAVTNSLYSPQLNAYALSKGLDLD